MKYGLIPQSTQEEVALKQAPHIQVMMDPFLSIVTARAVMAFVQLGIPNALGKSAKTVADLADELCLREDGLSYLLKVLTAAGYVKARKEKYELTPISRATLLEESPARLDAWVLHNKIHWRVLQSLEETLSKDGVRDLRHHLDSSEEWKIYQQAMMQTARPVAKAVAELLPVPGNREYLLDIGGSHGLYGAAICRRFPPMKSRVIDLPEAIEHARVLTEEEGIDNLVEFEAGDILEIDLGEKICDVVFMGNLVHHLDEEMLPAVLNKVFKALRPGGVIALWDMAPPKDQQIPDLITEGFSLLFYLSSASACRSTESYLTGLVEAGFADEKISHGPSPMHLLISARKE